MPRHLSSVVLCALLVVMPYGCAAFAADPIPGASCAVANAFQWSGGPENAGVMNGMICSGGKWKGIINFQPGGTVGLGTTNPDSEMALDVNGSMVVEGIPSGVYFNTNGGVGIDDTYGAFLHDASDEPVSLLTYGTAPIIFYTNNTERMRISPSGSVGIGTANPKATFDINGYMRLSKNNAQPAACGSGNDGAIALSHVYTLCICKGGTSSWVQSKDGITACSW
jgi:hypothetical protein